MLSHTLDMLQTGKMPLVPILLAIFVGVGSVGLYSLAHGLFLGHTSAPDKVSSLPAASLALTAYLQPDDLPHRPLEPGAKARPLLVTGWVTGTTLQETGAQVKLTLHRLKNDFYQTYLVKVEPDGKFEMPYVQGFMSVASDEPLYLTAETWLPNHVGRLERLSEEIYLNARPPILSAVTRYLLVLTGILLLGIFLWAFTGKSSPAKNRMAIVFSYIIIMIFLALPLLAPVLLPLAFPGALKVMRETPVGLVVTNVDSKSESSPQWALNIGGHISRTPDPSDPEAVEVKGGLIIPLYVILLSVIGGAINMTRQVPKFQEACEAQDNGLLRKVVGTLLNRPPTVPISSIGGNSSDESAQDVRETSARGGGSPSDPTTSGREEMRMGSIAWRTELLNQYMFLISAPFLAIATYYMLMGLDLTKVPIIVLVAFSVGLISEPILRTITDTAERFLRQPPASPPEGVRNVTRPGIAEPVMGK
jgi:hypothetical protein